MNQAISLAVLHELYLLAQADLPARVDILSRALRSDALTVGQALLRLESRGLVDASRCRLTMGGLVMAAATGAAYQRSVTRAA